MSFYCPIHDTTKCKTELIYNPIDSYDEYYCYQCFDNQDIFKKFKAWIRDTNSTLPTKVKKVMKEGSFFLYSEANLMYEIGHKNIQSVDHLFYYKNKPAHISLYECGNILSAFSYKIINHDLIDDVYEFVPNKNFKTSFRIRFETPGKFITKEVPDISFINKEVIGNIFDHQNLNSLLK